MWRERSGIRDELEKEEVEEEGEEEEKKFNNTCTWLPTDTGRTPHLNTNTLSPSCTDRSMSSTRTTILEPFPR